MPVSESELPAETKKAEISTASLEGIRILLALNAEIAASILQLKGMEVDRAVNGQEAVELYSSHPAEWFDIILMDLQMPVKDGLAACRGIRSADRTDAKTVPIIAMTANTFQSEISDPEPGHAGRYTGNLYKKRLPPAGCKELPSSE